MAWPVTPAPTRPISPRIARYGRPQGYTLVEILVATVLTLLLMAAVVRLFASIGEGVSSARSALEMSDQHRAAVSVIRSDLEGMTATATPPLHPDSNQGHFEYIEGPIGPVRPVGDGYAVRPDPDNPLGVLPDTTVGDIDDILIITTRSTTRPFTGRALVKRAPVPPEQPHPDSPDAIGEFVLEKAAQSQLAEVCYFVRGTTLYRRVLLILPEFDADLRTDDIEVQLHVDPDELDGPGFFADYDLSVHREFDPNDDPYLVANSLGDLTRRECRFAHQSPDGSSPPDGLAHFPFHPHLSVDSSGTVTRTVWADLGLPTLRECSDLKWIAGAPLPLFQLTLMDPDPNHKDNLFDAWENPHPRQELDPATGTLRAYPGPRVAEDVLLTNVLSFDVKIWDPWAPAIVRNSNPGQGDDGVYFPGDSDYQDALEQIRQNAPNFSVETYGAYVDLGYAPLYIPPSGEPVPLFHHLPNGPWPIEVRVYDTWSSHYEHDGMDQDSDGLIDEGTDGFDNNDDGVVDDPGEMETVAPYPYPARGIQIKLRVFEPDSRRIREVTIVQDFLPK